MLSPLMDDDDELASRLMLQKISLTLDNQVHSIKELRDKLNVLETQQLDNARDLNQILKEVTKEDDKREHLMYLINILINSKVTETVEQIFENLLDDRRRCRKKTKPSTH